VNNSREKPSKPSWPRRSQSDHEGAAFGAGLPTPPLRPTEGLHWLGGDLRSHRVRGRETRAQRGVWPRREGGSVVEVYINECSQREGL
jgi:hypothetical protein